MSAKKIIHGAKWLLSGNAIYAASQWVLLIILAKMGTPEMVGQFTLALSIAAPVYMLTNMQLRAIQVADSNENYGFSEYYSLRLLGVVVALIVISIFSLGINADVFAVVLIVSVMKGVEAITDIIYGALNAKNRTTDIAWSLMLKGVGSVVVFYVAIKLTSSIVAGVIGLTAIWFLILLLFDFRSIGYSKIIAVEFKWLQMFSLVKVAFPLGISVMLISLQANLPRFFLEKYFGSAEVGIYSALAYILVIGSVFINSIGQSISPHLAKQWAIGDIDGFKKTTIQAAVIAGALGLVSVIMVIIFGKQFLTLFYGEIYAKWNDALFIVMLSGAFLYMAAVFGYAITAAGALKQQVPMFVVILLGAFVASMLLIPVLGIMGAAWAAFITAMLQLAISYFIFRMRVR